MKIRDPGSGYCAASPSFRKGIHHFMHFVLESSNSNSVKRGTNQFTSTLVMFVEICPHYRIVKSGFLVQGAPSLLLFVFSVFWL